MDTIERISMTKKVIIIKANLLDVDPRLAKEIDTLKRDGYAVTLLCWDRDCKAPLRKQKDGEEDYNEIRLRLRAPWGVKVLPFLPIWWFFVFFQLMIRRQDIIVHGINFDSIIPVAIAAKMRKKNIIYEMFDIYEDAVRLPRIVRNVFVYIDKLFMRFADAVVIVDESRIKELDGIPNDNIVVIYNSPPDFLRKFKISNLQKSDIFTIFYAGLLNEGRAIDKVIASIKDMENVKLVIAGYGIQVKKTKKRAAEDPKKVQFIGKISYTDVLERSFSADLLFSLYDPMLPLHKFASSNKLFEAMMCGKAILVNGGTSMADIVRKYNCGIVVNSQDISEIQNVIIKLKNDTQLCKQLGENGRKAYEEKYNWRIMEKRLINVYKKIERERET